VICPGCCDHTVARDHYAARGVVETCLDASHPHLVADNPDPAVNGTEWEHLLDLAEQPAEPDLGIEARLDLVERMCEVLNDRTPPEEKQPIEDENGRRPRALWQPSPAPLE
jgi:hypothetical protein